MISSIEISVTSFYAHLGLWRPQIAGGKYSQWPNMRKLSQNQFLDTLLDA
jgi:hypothetical protein